MNPRHLKISGFLSYRDPVEIDFTVWESAPNQRIANQLAKRGSRRFF